MPAGNKRLPHPGMPRCPSAGTALESVLPPRGSAAQIHAYHSKGDADKNGSPQTLFDKENLEKKIKYLYCKDKITRRYYRYKILSKITFGKIKKKYKARKNYYHKLVRFIREETKL